jgi:perosamine synthetase
MIFSKKAMKYDMLKMGMPVATPIGPADIAAAFRVFLRPGDALELFTEQVMSVTGAARVYAVNSGRAALYIALRALATGSHRRDVIIPAFICPSVPKAIVTADLNVVLCDIRADNFGINPDALKKHLASNTLAVVATHLFGYPNDLTAITDMAAQNDVFIVEDAAQAFGARWNLQPVGTLADVGVFSFGISKVLSTMGGGLICVNDKGLIDRFAPFLDGLWRPNRAAQLGYLSKIVLLAMLAYSQHLGPLIYIWEKYFQGSGDLDDFNVANYSPAQAAIALRLLNRFADITASRRNNALLLERGLYGLPGIRIPQIPPESSPVYLRFPVVVDDINVKCRLVEKLKQKGICVSQMYERKSFESVCSLTTRTDRYPATEYLCERMINLPTHAFLTELDTLAIVDVFRNELT